MQWRLSFRVCRVCRVMCGVVTRALCRDSAGVQGEDDEAAQGQQLHRTQPLLHRRLFPAHQRPGTSPVSIHLTPERLFPRLTMCVCVCVCCCACVRCVINQSAFRDRDAARPAGDCAQRAADVDPQPAPSTPRERRGNVHLVRHRSHRPGALLLFLLLPPIPPAQLRPTHSLFRRACGVLCAVRLWGV